MQHGVQKKKIHSSAPYNKLAKKINKEFTMRQSNLLALACPIAAYIY